MKIEFLIFSNFTFLNQVYVQLCFLYALTSKMFLLFKNQESKVNVRCLKNTDIVIVFISMTLCPLMWQQTRLGNSFPWFGVIVLLSFPFLHYFAKKMSEKKKSVACVANMFSFQFSGLTHTLLHITFYSSTHFLVVIKNGTLFNDATRDSIANNFVIGVYCRCLQILYQIAFSIRSKVISYATKCNLA